MGETHEQQVIRFWGWVIVGGGWVSQPVGRPYQQAGVYFSGVCTQRGGVVAWQQVWPLTQGVSNMGKGAMTGAVIQH
jgi:hypothetical protein